MSQLSGWMGAYVNLGNHLEKARGAYEESTRKLRDSNQSGIKNIQKLENLGLSPKKSKARIKTTGRLAGPESIIPPDLTPEE